MKSLVDKQNRTRRENERRAITGRQRGLRLRCDQGLGKLGLEQEGWTWVSGKMLWF